MTSPAKIPRLSNNQIRYYLYRIYKLLKYGNINIAILKMKKMRGLSLLEQGIKRDVWLDPDDKILPTLIHECLHLLYWDQQEDWILAMEKRITKRISEKQMKNLLLLLAEQLKKSKQKSRHQ